MSHKRNVDVPLLSDCKYFCFVSGELPRSCKDVKSLKGVTDDGEYFLKVKGKTLKVRFSNRLMVYAFPKGARGPCVCSSLPLAFSTSSFLGIPFARDAWQNYGFSLSGVLFWDADWQPKGVRDPCKWGCREFFRSVWIQVRNAFNSELSNVFVCYGNIFLSWVERVFFWFRLHNPTECPYNGSRREDCQCRKDYTAAGFSTFSKVRLDLNTMQIISE